MTQRRITHTAARHGACRPPSRRRGAASPAAAANMAAATRRADVAIDPVCGMQRQSATPPSTASPIRGRTISSAARAAASVSKPSRKNSCAEAETARARGTGRHHLYLSDASRGAAGRPGLLPDLRHGAGAGAGLARPGAGSRTHRHDQAVLDRAGADAAGLRHRDGQPSRPWCISCRRCGRTGFPSCWRRRWCCGRARRFSSAAGVRW